MIKAWKLNHGMVAVMVRGEPHIAAALAATGLEDRCLTGHEAQFHIPIGTLHKYGRTLGLGSADQTALRQAFLGSDLVITVTREKVRAKAWEVQEATPA